MAAAALGNTISDAMGIIMGGTIESFAEKLGLQSPDFTSSEESSWQVFMELRFENLLL